MNKNLIFGDMLYNPHHFKNFKKSLRRRLGSYPRAFLLKHRNFVDRKKLLTET